MSTFYLHTSFVLCVLFYPPRTNSGKSKIPIDATWAALTLLVGLTATGADVVSDAAIDDQTDRSQQVVHKLQKYVNSSFPISDFSSNTHFTKSLEIIGNQGVVHRGVTGEILDKSTLTYVASRKRKRKYADRNAGKVFRDDKYFSVLDTFDDYLHTTSSSENEARRDHTLDIPTGKNNVQTLLNQNATAPSKEFVTANNIALKESKSFTNLGSSENISVTNQTNAEDDFDGLAKSVSNAVSSSNTNDTQTEYPDYTTDENVNSSTKVEGFDEDFVSAKPIYIQGLFEITGKECRKQPEAGIFEVKAAQLAIKHINRKRVIPGYKLELYENDTKCDSGVAVDLFFYALYRHPPKIMMVLGTGSSEVTERLARVVSRWNITQVSYGALSPALSDQKNFPRFYRTVAPDSSHNAALLAFIQYFKWDAVAALHEQGDRHALPVNKLVTDLEQANISVTFTKGVSERDYKEQLKELKVHDSRIVIGSFSHLLLKKIFCQIYHLGMFGAEYAWILQGDLKEAWWKDSSGTDCSDAELQEAVRGLIMVGSHYGIIGSTSSISNMTSEEVLESIGYETTPRDSGFVMQTYDALWVIALALRKSQEVWEADGQNLTLNDFSYSKNEMAEDISNNLGSLQFVGVSGPVSFHKSDRVGITAFHQLQGGDSNLVALYLPDSAELDFWCPDCKVIAWQGGGVPIARKIIKLRVAILDRTVFVCVTTVAVLGVALAITFLSFNLYYRRSKFIKLSSPNLNNFVVVGCVLVYVAVILLGMDHGALASDNHFPFICSARAFLLSGGFSLAFGCMFIKTYRVYHIFIRTNTGIVKSKLLHDQQLLGMVSVLVLIDCVLVTLWVTVDPMERQLRNLTMQVNKAERNVVYLDQREQCNSVHMAKWLGTLYIYKGLLLVVGCYMAWETRHVKIPALNDSQYIGMSVYNVVITSVIVVAMANVIPVERYTLTFILVSTLIFVSTTTTLCLLFVPKIHTILINPEGSTVVATPGVKVECKTRRFVIDEPRESIYRAEVINRVLKRELQELDDELARLTGRPRGPSAKKSQDSKRIRLTSVDSDHQDEDSDDGLPPWLDDYKEYSSSGSDVNWYMGNQRSMAATGSSLCASALTALRPMFLCPSDEPTSSTQHKETDRKSQAMDCREYKGLTVHQEHISSVRKSLPTVAVTIQEYRPVFGASDNHLSPVRSCLSDRALDSVGGMEVSPELAVRSLSKHHSNIKSSARSFVSQLQNAASAIFTRHLGSEPRLSNLPLSLYDRSGKSCGVKSLGDVSGVPKQCTFQRKMSSMEDSNLIFTENGTSGSDNMEESRLLSENTTASGDSAWATAPLYYSTSFSTPAEDVSLATNHQGTSSNSQTPTPPFDDFQPLSVCTVSPLDSTEGGDLVTVQDNKCAASCLGVESSDPGSNNFNSCAQNAKTYHGSGVQEISSEVASSHPKELEINTTAGDNISKETSGNSKRVDSSACKNPESNTIQSNTKSETLPSSTRNVCDNTSERARCEDPIFAACGKVIPIAEFSQKKVKNNCHCESDCDPKQVEHASKCNFTSSAAKHQKAEAFNKAPKEYLPLDTPTKSNKVKSMEIESNNPFVDCNPNSEFQEFSSNAKVMEGPGTVADSCTEFFSQQQSPVVSNSSDQKPASVQSINHDSSCSVSAQDNRQVQRDSLREQIFLLERDLIFLELDGAESIDL